MSNLKGKKSLEGKKIAVVIGGSIAAYKSLELIRRLKDLGADTHVILTEAGKKFVTKLSAAAVSHNKVLTDLFSDDGEEISHIELASKIDLLIIAPATADRMAQMALGLAGDLSGAVFLATKAKILCAPAMNPNMWQHKATQRAVEQLRTDGVNFIGPNSGAMAEKNHFGVGRMAEPLEIVAEAERLLLKDSYNPLKGKKFVVTLGATQEELDPVRFISNHSSGKQGAALANALSDLGAEVVAICGVCRDIKLAPQIKTIKAISAHQMLEAVQENMICDAFISAAAVCDWRAKQVAAQKLKKQKDQDEMQILLVKNTDIVQFVAKSQNRPKLVVAFSAETENHLTNAFSKLNSKAVDFILLNNVGNNSGQSSAFYSDNNQITIVRREGDPITLPAQSKVDLAKEIALFIAEHYF